MQRVKHVVMGFVSMVCLAVGMNIGTPVGSHAQSDFENDVLNDLGELKNGQDALGSDHSNLEANQAMIKETLDVIEANQAMTHEWLTKIEEALGAMEGTQVGSKCDEEGSEEEFVRFGDNIFCQNDTGDIVVLPPNVPNMTYNEAEQYCNKIEEKLIAKFGDNTYTWELIDLLKGLEISIDVINSDSKFSTGWANIKDSKNPDNAKVPVINYKEGTVTNQFPYRKHKPVCEGEPKGELNKEELRNIIDDLNDVINPA